MLPGILGFHGHPEDQEALVVRGVLVVPEKQKIYLQTNKPTANTNDVFRCQCYDTELLIDRSDLRPRLPHVR